HAVYLQLSARTAGAGRLPAGTRRADARLPPGRSVDVVPQRKPLESRSGKPAASRLESRCRADSRLPYLPGILRRGEDAIAAGGSGRQLVTSRTVSAPD